MWSTEAAPIGDVGAMLRRLHDRCVIDGSRGLPSDSPAVFAQSRAMVSGLDLPDRLFEHLAAGADAADRGSGARSLVHTDCGPGNIVVGRDGPCLIDWQCPGIGDPVEDLANFASSAIQVPYHRPPLTPAQTNDLLVGYGDSPASAAFADLRWSYHVRLAAFCAYRHEELINDQPDISELYAVALEAELDLLDTRP